MSLHHPQLVEMANELYSFVQDAYHSPKAGKLLIMHGPNGCGKTHAARAVHRWFEIVRMKMGPVACQTEEGSEAIIPNSIMRNWPGVVDGFKQDQWLIVDRLMSEYLVIIDDIGAEHDPSKIGMEKLYLILSRREFKHTVITTNAPPGEWENKFERRIASRMFRNSTLVDLSQVPDFNAA